MDTVHCYCTSAKQLILNKMKTVILFTLFVLCNGEPTSDAATSLSDSYGAPLTSGSYTPFETYGPPLVSKTSSFIPKEAPAPVKTELEPIVEVEAAPVIETVKTQEAPAHSATFNFLSDLAVPSTAAFELSPPTIKSQTFITPSVLKAPTAGLVTFTPPATTVQLPPVTPPIQVLPPLPPVQVPLPPVQPQLPIQPIAAPTFPAKTTVSVAPQISTYTAPLNAIPAPQTFNRVLYPPAAAFSYAPFVLQSNTLPIVSSSFFTRQILPQQVASTHILPQIQQFPAETVSTNTAVSLAEAANSYSLYEKESALATPNKTF